MFLYNIFSLDVSIVLLVQDEGQQALAGIMITVGLLDTMSYSIQHREHCGHVILLNETHNLFHVYKQDLFLHLYMLM